MSKEIIHAIESIHDREVMEEFIKRQDVNGCSILIDTLRHTNEETEKRWLDVYSNIFKY